MTKITTVLDVVGALLIVVFAYFLWWPLALLAGGLLCLVASFLLTRGGES